MSGPPIVPPSRFYIDWTPELIARVTEMAPSHSAREIADACGLTRNQVLGKLSRLSVPLGRVSNAARPTPTLIERAERQRGYAAAHAEKKRATAALTPPTSLDSAAAVVSPPIAEAPIPELAASVLITPTGWFTLLELPERGCKWPGEEVDGVRFFCGAMAILGRPYCDKHANMALGVSTKPWGGRPRYEGRAISR